MSTHNPISLFTPPSMTGSLDYRRVSSETTCRGGVTRASLVQLRFRVSTSTNRQLERFNDLTPVDAAFSQEPFTDYLSRRVLARRSVAATRPSHAEFAEGIRHLPTTGDQSKKRPWRGTVHSLTSDTARREGESGHLQLKRSLYLFPSVRARNWSQVRSTR